MGGYTNSQQMYYPYQPSTTQWSQATNNAGTSSALLQPAHIQQSLQNSHLPTILQQWQAPSTSSRQENHPTPIPQRIALTSEEEEDILCNDNSNNGWQVVRGAKRRKTKGPQQSAEDHPIEVSNMYDSLPTEPTGGPTAVDATTERTPKPPPIFVHGVVKYDEMIKRIKDVAEETKYATKSLTNGVIKIICSTPDTHRNMVKYFNDNHIYHHTYQLKTDRAYRIVIKYLHFSTDIADIKLELCNLGHKVRNITNARNRVTKQPLNLFFVDLEPAENNKDIYSVKAIQNRIVKIEPPRANKHHQVQCMRCQQYGHTKRYCNMPYACVKCGGDHSTVSCTKNRDSPATCALCGGNHPANYKGCDHYQNYIKNKTTHVNGVPSHTTARRAQPQYNTDTYQPQSYAEIARKNTHQVADVPGTFTQFINEFKGLFHQLLQQNNMVLNMLTMLINKLNNG
jgi:hypothetical protein